MWSSLALGLALLASQAPVSPKHVFTLGKDDFLLDGKPFQMISGELHPARIPPEYWRHRVQMAKAMGCNTVAAYLFWNFHEPEEGKFDFRSPARDVARFLRIAKQEGLWVLLRPGPYVCAEWDLGGIPPYLLRRPDIKLRCSDPAFMTATRRYLVELAKVIKPYLAENGGPILMIQIENEYGSYGNDRAYMASLKAIWESAGVKGPFYTADGPTPYMLEAGSLPGCAVGLDSGSAEDHWTLARRMNPGVPIFSSETYPGWLTHWGEKWASVGTEGVVKEVRWLLDHKKSFNLYVLHGGTNFSFTAGANSGGKGYEPDVTSYDYDAPVDEQGNATPKYRALRELVASHLGTALPPIPKPIPTTEIPAFPLRPYASVWQNLPKAELSVQPKPFEAFGQDYGFRLYRTKLIGHKSGRLSVNELHDYATVFVDGKYVGKLDRREGVATIDLPKTESKTPVLELLVEGMGRINFAQHLSDRKGITDRVTLNGMTLMSWQSFGLPMADAWIAKLPSDFGTNDRPGIFLKGEFSLKKPADTFFDTSELEKGVLWVNGHNLGRYWRIGPQTRLFCPASWLKPGRNEVLAFDLHQMAPVQMQGFSTLS